MWFLGGVFSRTATSSGSSGSMMNMMSNSLVRHFSRKRGENLRKINPKVAPQEASNIAQDLYRLINQRGPLTISNAWIQAQVLPFSSFPFLFFFIVIIDNTSPISI